MEKAACNDHPQYGAPAAICGIFDIIRGANAFFNDTANERDLRLTERYFRA
jgi:hypothetical protein